MKLLPVAAPWCWLVIAMIGRVGHRHRLPLADILAVLHCVSSRRCRTSAQRAWMRAPAVCACVTCSRSPAAASWQRSRSTPPLSRYGDLDQNPSVG